MSGECKSYKLNDPMKWDEFKSLPDDLKVGYIKLIRERFGATDCKIAEMLGVHKVTFYNFVKTLGCSMGNHGKRLKLDEGGWYAWVNGMPMPEKTEEVAEEETPVVEEPTEPVKEEPVQEEKPEMLKAFFFKEEKNRAIPSCGSMTFEGRIEDIANTLLALLGGAKVHIGIQWDVLED